MTGLFEMLTPQAQNDLIHDHVIEIITITVQYPPEPDPDSNRVGYCEPYALKTMLPEDDKRFAESLTQIREISSHAMDDFQGHPMHCMMKEALENKKHINEIFQNDERCREFLPYLMTGVFIWQISLVAWMEDDGLVITEIEYWIDESVVDKETQILIHERMKKIIDVMDRI